MRTPGPWVVNGENSQGYSQICVANPDIGWNVALCLPGSNRDPFKDEMEANAAFIVRACNAHDDLLEACKEAFNNFMGSPGFWHTRGELPSIGKILESAISKAERGEWK